METIAHKAVGRGRIFVVRGDLTRQRVEGVVNAANEHLAHGGGVAAAIVRTGGRVIQEESDQWLRDHGPLGPGDAAVTTGGMLQASHVIHVVGPRYRPDADNEGLLRTAVTAALDAAESVELQSIAMPAISAGVFGYPRDEAARVISEAVADWFTGREQGEGHLREVRLVGFDRDAAADFAAAVEAL
jgi:O-acetyl-ADP-ribose deacetylase (regulator of RNase III)